MTHSLLAAAGGLGGERSCGAGRLFPASARLEQTERRPSSFLMHLALRAEQSPTTPLNREPRCVLPRCAAEGRWRMASRIQTLTSGRFSRRSAREEGISRRTGSESPGRVNLQLEFGGWRA